MECENDLNRLEQTVADLKEYGQLQLDKLKLRLLDNFATLLNHIFSVFILVILSCFVLTFLAIALTLALAAWVNSMLGAVLIMAGVFVIALVVAYVLRHRLIINKAVRMLGKTMFETDKADDYE